MEQLAEFIGNHPFLVAAAAATGGMLIFNEIRLATTGQFAVSPDQAVRLMNKGAVVLDLRDRDAYEKGHLIGARHFDAAAIDAQAEALSRFRTKPVITYDERGTGAARVAAALRKRDFENAFALRGGLLAWREEQLPLEKPQRKAGRDKR